MTMEDCPSADYVAFSPREARQFVRRTLAALSLDELADDAELLVSEVVTNAVLHGGGTCAPVSVQTVAGGIRVEVVDPGDAFDAVPAEFDITTPGGLGLGIVDSLASRWGVVPTFQGKVVWFELTG